MMLQVTTLEKVKSHLSAHTNRHCLRNIESPYSVFRVGTFNFEIDLSLNFEAKVE